MDAELRQRDHIHVALDNQQVFQRLVGLAGLVQAVELVALMEYRGFGRVQVLGFFVAKGPAPKADDPAAQVVDGKGHAVPKPVIGTAIILADGQARLGGDAAVAHGVGNGLPGIGCIADAEALGGLAIQPPALEVVDGLGRAA